MNPIAQRLRGQALRIKRERRVYLGQSFIEMALVEKGGAASEVLTNRANEFESFGHDA